MSGNTWLSKWSAMTGFSPGSASPIKPVGTLSVVVSMPVVLPRFFIDASWFGAQLSQGASCHDAHS